MDNVSSFARDSISIVLSVVAFCSCSHKPDSSLAVFNALEENSRSSIESITTNNKIIYSALQDKLSDPVSKEKAIVIYPRAMHIKDLSDRMTAYIEQLKDDLKKEAGANKNDKRRSFRVDNKNAVTKLFITKGKGEELYKRLISYKDSLLLTDPGIQQEFSKNLRITTALFESPENKWDFTETYFRDISVIAALAMLNAMEVNVKVAENKTILYINARSHVFMEDFSSSFSVIVAQNSTYLRAGETFEISAGVGSFTRTPNPKIMINGTPVPIDPRGVAVYKTTAKSVPGKYSIPVKITYIDQEGRQQIIENPVKYTVAKEPVQ